jgi:hypothetical protein
MDAMNFRGQLAAVACAALVAASGTAQAQSLYTQNFDVNDTANWTVNPGNVDFSVPGSTTPVTTDTNIFFDYSTVGIPPAPNSTGGSTRGMRLQANLSDGTTVGIFGGYSVSPTGKSFTGDYSLKFDLWTNYLGSYNADLTSGGVGVSAAGGTMLSTYGIMTSGTYSNSPGFIDGVMFANSGDGGTATDYRAYAAERTTSYQVPAVAGNVEDTHAVHLAGSRNNTATLYTDNFGGATVPAAQTALTAYDYNGTPKNLSETQYGTTPAGTMGMEWHRVEVRKAGTLISWIVDGITLITVESSGFTKPTGGNNIMFGHADINSGVSNDPNYNPMMFTLIDNIEVTALTAPGLAGDFNGDNKVDGADFLVWQRGGSPAPLSTTDLNAWKANFGTAGTPPIAAVPEPASFAMAGLAVAALAAARRRRAC